jgi:hypothetical protein
MAAHHKARKAHKASAHKAAKVHVAHRKTAHVKKAAVHHQHVKLGHEHLHKKVVTSITSINSQHL